MPDILNAEQSATPTGTVSPRPLGALSPGHGWKDTLSLTTGPSEPVGTALQAGAPVTETRPPEAPGHKAGLP